VHIKVRFHKCKYEGCYRKFFLKKNLKTHNKNAHPKKATKEENIIYNCSHNVNCSKFKTNRQRIRHHNKHEHECVRDKLILINVLHQFKTTIQKLIYNNNLEIKKFINSNSFKKLKENFTSFVEGNLLNKELFFTKFGYECLDILEYK